MMHQRGKIIFLLVIALITTSSLMAAPVAIHLLSDTLIHGTPIKISDQFSFTEGPAADASGNIYFTDQPNSQIWKYSTDGKLSLFLSPSGRSNGMFFDSHGNLISCADSMDQLWLISPDKKTTVLVNDYKGARLNGPNDVWVSPKGGIYITDPYYQRKYWKRKAPDPKIKGMYVYYLPPRHSRLRRVVTSLKKPNGIVGTPDGKHLYIADIDAGKTYRFDISRDGSLKKKTLFVNQGSDGLTIDSKGNVYLTGKGITIYNSKGVKMGHINIPEPWSANVCFGGKDRKMLFITASTAIYKVQINVKGVK